MPLLAIKNLTKFFGGLAAVMDFNMDVERGQILGLIGPNGAGKSTVLNMIGGTLRPNQGEIIFNEKDVTKLPPHVRAMIMEKWNNASDAQKKEAQEEWSRMSDGEKQRVIDEMQ